MKHCCFQHTTVSIGFSRGGKCVGSRNAPHAQSPPGSACTWSCHGTAPWPDLDIALLAKCHLPGVCPGASFWSSTGKRNAGCTPDTINLICKQAMLFINNFMLQNVIRYVLLCKKRMLFYIHIRACLIAGFVTLLINSGLKCLSHSMTFRCLIFFTKLIKTQICTSLSVQSRPCLSVPLENLAQFAD